MNLFDVVCVDFQNVKEAYKLLGKGDFWEERNLARANDKFGTWIIAKIHVEDIGDIVMPRYKIGEVHITPDEGSTLGEMYRNFSSNKSYFAVGDPQFCDRVETQKRLIQEGGMRAIFLSEEPLFMGTSYSGLLGFRGHITHLDGFHRLVALKELLRENKFRNKYIECYIAVYKDSKLLTSGSRSA